MNRVYAAGVALWFCILALWGALGIADLYHQEPTGTLPTITPRAIYELPPVTMATPVPHFAPSPLKPNTDMIFLSCLSWGILYATGCAEVCSGNYGCSYTWPARGR